MSMEDLMQRRARIADQHFEVAKSLFLILVSSPGATTEAAAKRAYGDASTFIRQYLAEDEAVRAPAREERRVAVNKAFEEVLIEHPDWDTRQARDEAIRRVNQASRMK